MLITVNKQGISVTNAGILVSNSIGQYTASVSFSPEWANYDKVVVFKNGGTVKEIAVDGQDIVVPWEVLEKEGTLEIGAYGLEGANKRPTVWGKPLAILKGVEEGETAHEPTILPWEELARRIGDLSQLETETHESLVAAVNEVLSTVPAFLSELTPDVEHMTVSQAEKTEWSGKADTSDIPTNVSELENDAGYITQEEVPEITATAINNALGYTAADNADVQENAQEISQISESITEIQRDKADRSELPKVPVKSVSAGGSALTPDDNGNVDVPFFTSTQAGVIRASSDFGVQIVTDGMLRTRTLTSSQYADTYNSTFIGKGTLENVLATPSIMPTLTESEQAAARQRIGFDKEWTLKGTITTENKSDGVIVDLTGCTELVIRGTILCIADTTGISFDVGALISASDGIPISNNMRYAYMRYVDGFDGIEPVLGKYRSADALPNFINATLNLFAIPAKRIKDITLIKPAVPGRVDACSLEIYAR